MVPYWYDWFRIGTVFFFEYVPARSFIFCRPWTVIGMDVKMFGLVIACPTQCMSDHGFIEMLAFNKVFDSVKDLLAGRLTMGPEG